MPPRQLLVYTFGPGSGYEGQLVGALERIESGGAIRVLDALFVTREPQTGELNAVSLEGGTSGGVIGRVVDFRLDTAARAEASRRALSGPLAEIVQALAERIDPGGAIAAVLVEHAWANTLDEAVRRIGGEETANSLVEATRLIDAAEPLIKAAERPAPG